MKSYITVTSVALVASMVGLSEASVRELPSLTKQADTTAPAVSCDAGVQQVFDAVSRLDSNQYNKVVNEYCMQNTQWAPSMAHKALLTAALDGHVRSQVELVKCHNDGSYGASQDEFMAARWLDNVLASTDVSSMHDLQEYFQNKNGYSRLRDNALRRINARLEELKTPEPSEEKVEEEVVEEADKIQVRNEDGSLTDEYVNYIVEQRFSLLTSNSPEAGVFEALFTEEVLELKSGTPVNRANLLAKAQKIVNEWPKRGIEILEVGISGLKVEICYAFLFANASGKEVAAYNKMTLLIGNEGKIAGMQEIITAGDRPSLTPKYKSFNYTGPKTVSTVDK